MAYRQQLAWLLMAALFPTISWEIHYWTSWRCRS